MDDTGEQLARRDRFLRKMAAKLTPEQHLRRLAERRQEMWDRLQGDPANQLHERHDASDFDTKPA